MTTIKPRIRVSPDGTLTRQTAELHDGEYEAAIVLQDTATRQAGLDADALLARVRAIQVEVARFPVLDNRSPDEITGYNERGHFN
jgi:hypothetical protein